MTNLNSLLKKVNERPKKEFGEFLKNEKNDIIDKYIETLGDKKLPEKMINNISKNIQSEKKLKFWRNKFWQKNPLWIY